jgi:hypothetical protein
MGWSIRRSRDKGLDPGTRILSDAELAAVELLVRYKMGEPQDPTNTLFCAWQKLVAITLPKA